MRREAMGAESIFVLGCVAGVMTSPWLCFLGFVAALHIMEHEKAATLKGAAWRIRKTLKD